MATRKQDVLEWLARLEDDSSRQAARFSGGLLQAAAVSDGIVANSEQGGRDLGRLIAELRNEGMIAFRYHPGPGRSEPPDPSLWDAYNVQSIGDLTVTTQGRVALRQLAQPTVDVEGRSHPEHGTYDEPADRATTSDEFEYDVALSFAGEDRAYVQPIAERLRASGLRVFYDEFHPAKTWGAELLDLFDDVFRKNSRFAVIFVSRSYAEKVWPKYEHRSAQARAMVQESVYLLPIRLDDTELAGLRPTVGYLDAKEYGRDRIVELILEKLAIAPSVDRVPRTLAEEAALLATRMGAWEYLYFAAVLLRQRDALATKWRDHQLRYSKPQGDAISESDAADYVSSMFRRAQSIVSNVDRILTLESQELAFGASDEPGDAMQIEHLAQRVVDIYEELLDWSASLRGSIMPDEWRGVVDSASRFGDLPLQQIRDFIDEFVLEMDSVPARLKAGEQGIRLEIELVVSADEAVVNRFTAELERLKP